jgi:hypothetical protein
MSAQNTIGIWGHIKTHSDEVVSPSDDLAGSSIRRCGVGVLRVGGEGLWDLGG